MRLITATNNLIVINFKIFLELILWMIQLLISPYALEAGAASDFDLDKIRSRRPWFCLPHHCWENLLRLVYWKISIVSFLLRIIYWKSLSWSLKLSFHSCQPWTLLKLTPWVIQLRRWVAQFPSSTVGARSLFSFQAFSEISALLEY